MIIGFLVNSILNLVEFMIEILPNGTGFPVDFYNGVSTFKEYAYGLNAILPINTLFQVMIFGVTVQVAILTIRIIRWVLSMRTPMR